MDHHENMHCTETAYSCRYHYKANVCAGCKDDFDRVELRNKYSTYPTLAFEMPRQRFELERVEQMMELAYKRGRSDNKNAIAGLIKELIAL